jgi:hypothetical protein
MSRWITLRLISRLILAQLQQGVERFQHAGLVAFVQVAQARAVDGDHAQRAGLLGRAKQAVAALEQFAQIQLQAAAHGADHVRLEFRIDEVLEIRQAVLGGHLEQQFSVRRWSQSKSSVML